MEKLTKTLGSAPLPGVPTPEQLGKIGRYTRRAFAPEELYVFTAVLCDNQIDRDGERFSEDCLRQLAGLFVGVTGIFDHDPTAAGQHARIFETRVEADPAQPTNCGQPYTALKAEVYMLRTGASQGLMDEIEAGIKKEISISCAIGRSVCSVCGEKAGNCSHIPGKEYAGAPCHIVHQAATDAYEWSFVAVPAQRRAGVTKRAGNRPEAAAPGEAFLAVLGRKYLEQLRAECIRLNCIAVPELSRSQAESMAAGLDPEELEGCVRTLQKAAGRQIPLHPQLGVAPVNGERDSAPLRYKKPPNCAGTAQNPLKIAGMGLKPAISGGRRAGQMGKRKFSTISTKDCGKPGRQNRRRSTKGGKREMTIRLNGYGVSYATFAAAEGLEAGALAKLSGNREVTAAGAGEAFIGLVVSVRDHLALVQLAGICTLPYTGAAPAVGYARLAADGAGGIQAAEGGRQLLITAVDSTDNTAEVLL